MTIELELDNVELKNTIKPVLENKKFYNRQKEKKHFTVKFSLVTDH